MKKNEIKGETVWQHRVMIFLYHFVRRWPDWTLYRIFSPLLAFVAFVFSLSLRNAAIKNMRQVTRAQGVQSNRLVWGRAYLVLLHNAYNWADLIRTFRRTVEEISRDVELVGLENIEQVSDRAMVVSAHTSGYFAASLALAEKGFYVYVMAEELENPTLDELVQGLRNGMGHTVVPLGFPAIKEAMGRLSKGGLVGLLVDRVIERDIEERSVSAEVLFFGRPAKMSTGPARMAKGANCPIVFVTCERIGWQRFRVEFYPPIYPSGYDDEVQLTKELVSLVEAHVEENPSQWLPLKPIWEEGDI